MSNDGIIIYLVMATFAMVLVYAVIQVIKVNKAKRDGTRSAMAKSRGEPPSSPAEKNK